MGALESTEQRDRRQAQDFRDKNAFVLEQIRDRFADAPTDPVKEGIMGRPVGAPSLSDRIKAAEKQQNRQAETHTPPITGIPSRTGDQGPSAPVAAATPAVPASSAPALAQPTPAAPVATAAPTAPVDTTPFSPYKSTAPETDIDGQIRIAHDIANMAGMAGIPHEALRHTQIWKQLHDERTTRIGDEAIRALAMGDPTKAFAMYNHVVPNGREITGYRELPDKSGYEIQYADGKSHKATSSDIANALVQYKDPGFLGKMAFERAKKNSELQNEAMKQLMIGQRNASLEEQKARHTKALEEFKHQLGADEIQQLIVSSNPADPGVYARTKKGIFKMTDSGKKDVNGKPLPATMKPVSIEEFNRAAATGYDGTQQQTAPPPVSAGGITVPWGSF